MPFHRLRCPSCGRLGTTKPYGVNRHKPWERYQLCECRFKFKAIDQEKFNDAMKRGQA